MPDLAADDAFDAAPGVDVPGAGGMTAPGGAGLGEPGGGAGMIAPGDSRARSGVGAPAPVPPAGTQQPDVSDGGTIDAGGQEDVGDDFGDPLGEGADDEAVVDPEVE